MRLAPWWLWSEPAVEADGRLMVGLDGVQWWRGAMGCWLISLSLLVHVVVVVVVVDLPVNIT